MKVQLKTKWSISKTNIFDKIKAPIYMDSPEIEY